MSKDQRTPTAEENALFAVMEGDTEAAIEILEDFFPSELRAFGDQVERLSALIDVEMTKKAAR